MTLTLLLNQGSSSAVSGLQLTDELGNPFPAGVQVSITALGQPGTTVATDYTRAGGVCPAILNLVPGSSYVASFVARQAPLSSCTFTANLANTVSVTGYLSPSRSIAGYAALQAQLWPKGSGWFGDAARAPGGLSYAIACGIGAIIESSDLQVQTELERVRLQSCSGIEIQTWANDFLGSLFYQFTGEPDSAYIARISAWLSMYDIFTSIPCLQQVANLFFGILPYLPVQGPIGADVGVGGADTWGSADVTAVSGPLAGQQGGMGADVGEGGADTSRGADVASPTYNYPVPLVFDRMTNPTLSALVGLEDGEAQVCIYTQYPGIPDSSIHTITNEPTILAQWINAAKAGGVTPVYATNLVT